MTRKGTGRPAVDGPAEKQTTGRGSHAATTVTPITVTTAGRPRCGVVGVYCEALGWLRREPTPASVWCRHYWAEVA